MSHPNGPPPLFAPSSGNRNTTSKSTSLSKGGKVSLNFDELLDDVMFTPDGDTVFRSEQSNEILHSGEGEKVATRASRMTKDGRLEAVQEGGGLYTTQLDKNEKLSLAMGKAGSAPSTAPIPYLKNPQNQRQLQFAVPQSKEKSERRERNREQAKRSRMRQKFLLESLQQSVALLRDENEMLRRSIRQHLGDVQADTLLRSREEEEDFDGLLASSQGIANKVLDDPDFSFIKALQTAEQNFVVSDPHLPDNPIVYASQGFLNLTGYTQEQVLGRNCRFVQGPETDPFQVDRIRQAIADGNDVSVCLLNYRADGSTFWNQFFIAALRDADGEVTNFVGVQCKVSDQYAATVTKQQEEDGQH